jgi:hypothetical protein
VAQRDKIKEGLIAIFTAVEPCLSYAVRGDHRTKKSQTGVGDSQVYALLPLLSASPIWAIACTRAELVPL